MLENVLVLILNFIFFFPTQKEQKAKLPRKQLCCGVVGRLLVAAGANARRAWLPLVH